MGFFLFATVYFCLGLMLGLSRLSIVKVVVTAVILLGLGAMMIGGLAVLPQAAISFGPVIGFSTALGRFIRQMRKGR